MNSHPWIGLSATASNRDLGDVHGLILTVGVDWFTLLEDGGAIARCPFYALRMDDPTEARRRLETAGAPAPAPDYEAVGRGIVKQLADGGMLGGGDTPGWRIIADLGEAIGRGIASARGGGA